MENLNSKRILVKIIKELQEELSFKAEFISEDWIIIITHNNKDSYIYGNHWSMNSATMQLIAKDKSATYDILSKNKIPAIEHKLIFSHDFQAKYTGQNGCWDEIMNYAKEHEYNVVCKPNKGTGGNDVYHITNQLELESVVHTMLSKYPDLCLSPFYKIDAEYRAIVLNGKTQLLYQKERPFIIGNGKDTLLTLIIEKYKKAGLVFLENNMDKLSTVICKDEKIIISWKHNLGLGAKAIVVKDKSIIEPIEKIVNEASKTFDIGFASIDIVSTSDKYYVLEINSGIMMENFALQKTDDEYNYYEITKSIYRDALRFLFQTKEGKY